MTEGELAAYYDREGAARANRALAPRRVEARQGFLASYASAGMRCLEVGTGGGQDAAAFVEAGLTVFGIDLSPVFAVFARERGASVANGTARRLPFRDTTFDLVWSMSVLMHVPDDGIEEALDEMRRVMTPAAVACIGVWGGDGASQMLDGAYGTRYFANRTETTWRQLLGRVGAVDAYEVWDSESDGFTYHWAVVRRSL